MNPRILLYYYPRHPVTGGLARGGDGVGPARRLMTSRIAALCNMAGIRVAKNTSIYRKKKLLVSKWYLRDFIDFFLHLLKVYRDVTAHRVKNDPKVWSFFA